MIPFQAEREKLLQKKEIEATQETLNHLKVNLIRFRLASLIIGNTSASSS